MTPGVFIIVILFLAVGCMLGWHAQRARSAHDDVRSTKRSRLPGFRKTRMRSSLWVLGIAVLAILVFSALLRH
jgi:ABC-type Fe3+ transport system permease subunit